MRIVSSVKSVSQDSKCSFMLPPWMLMELLCNCKRLKAGTYIRADTLHLLYKFHGLSFYSMWVDYDLQVLYMSITGPRSPSTGWRFWSCTGGCQLIRRGFVWKIGSWFFDSPHFSRICLGPIFLSYQGGEILIGQLFWGQRIELPFCSKNVVCCSCS